MALVCAATSPQEGEAMLRLVLLALYLIASYSSGQVDIGGGLDPNGRTTPTTDIGGGWDPNG